jgi:L-seryl-tRNA(Ser) seleniumtransferase
MAGTHERELLRSLPSVDALAAAAGGEHPHLAVAAAREEIAALRSRIVGGEALNLEFDALGARVAARAQRMARSSIRPVINATGVVLHTNLGRAPLAPEAIDAAAVAARGYSNLELDLESGERGSRRNHLEPLLRELSGAEAALAVNNNAAAVLLALSASASGREVIVGRGQLIEIGGEFRVPEILVLSGARLVEVGTTNRTRRADYERAIGANTAAILRVHQSNFRTVGFTEEASLAELAELARERSLALIDDLGSGALAAVGDEPPLRSSVAAGADLVCCSADKLLGGPQAGIIVGTAEAVAVCARHPLARAVRLDKLQLAALEATLRLHRDAGPEAIPALAMLGAGEDELQSRAERLAAAIGRAAGVGRSTSRPGGGSLPLLELEGPACIVAPGPAGADRVVAGLRDAEPPVIARISEGNVVLDPRTIADGEVEATAAATRSALGRPR